MLLDDDVEMKFNPTKDQECKEEEDDEGWPDDNSDNEVKLPQLMETYGAWIPHTAQEIEDRVKMIKTIIKQMEFAEVIKRIKFMSQRNIH